MNSIIITTINLPTVGIRKYAKLPNSKVIIIGDKKTPDAWNCKGVLFISVRKQDGLKLKLLSKLPYNHYARKMIGYLIALKNRSEFIIDTDDDNIPNSKWKIPEFNGKFREISGKDRFVNIYNFYSKEQVWPRGFPLEKINLPNKYKVNKRLRKVAVWQGLADADPDVDAIFRLTNKRKIHFLDHGNYVLKRGYSCPFNSQNTIWSSKFAILMYLPAFVSFRFTDILRSYIAQPIIWNSDYVLGFQGATVIQKRNTHNLMSDFKSEIPMYLNSKIIYSIQSVVKREKSMSENLISVYKKLYDEGVVVKQEIELLNLWIQDVESVMGK